MKLFHFIPLFFIFLGSSLFGEDASLDDPYLPDLKKGDVVLIGGTGSGKTYSDAYAQALEHLNGSRNLLEFNLRPGLLVRWETIEVRVFGYGPDRIVDLTQKGTVYELGSGDEGEGDSEAGL